MAGNLSGSNFNILAKINGFSGNRLVVFPCFYTFHGNTRFDSQFWLGKVGFDPFQQQVMTQGFDIDRNQFPGAKSLLEMVKFDQHCSVCKSQQLTQPAADQALAGLRIAR